MFNRSGVIALAIAAAIIAWGAFYKDEPEPPAAAAHAARHHEGRSPDHGKRDGGMSLVAARNGGHGADGGSVPRGIDDHH